MKYRIKIKTENKKTVYIPQAKKWFLGCWTGIFYSGEKCLALDEASSFDTILEAENHIELAKEFQAEEKIVEYKYL